ncbi:Fungal specific transcription factor domain-containing protein [Pleurostoma richardsiae]|uniref:Fungal specific transcription factor domain-containing protein n=1 Tax=Pleurostoma richardsiae TaxID=41990 RepID=A0AA38R331_9PEZI|nr:Fungal specific transcription factor domain-containing protein [Pleurostoma richardsiae]
MTRDRHASRASFACVRSLYRRIAALEDVIKNMSQADAVSDKDASHQSDHQIDLQPATDTQACTQSAFLSPTNSASPHSGSQRPTPPANVNETWSSADKARPSKSIASVSFSSQRGSVAQDLAECFPSGMDEVAAPAGHFVGQASSRNSQYFGSPSLFPYSERQSGTQGTGSDRDGATPEEEANRRSRAALEASPEPEPIIAHLLDLFWKWQSCHLLVIDRGIFLRHRSIWDESGGNGDRNFYTPCLLYAILSMASLISPDAGVRRYSAPDEGIPGEKFAKRSRALFELEMEHPTITTVQTALILGSRYGAMVDNSLGWTYSGTAFRIASKLGLHLDCTKAVASGHIAAETAKLRRIVFWGCHIEDNLFSSYCSRPTFFMDWDITTPLPSSPPDSDAPDGSSKCASLLHTTSALSLMCSKILVSLYGQRRQSTAAHLHSLASQVHRDLWQWYQDLPAEFTLADHDETKVLAPEVFILHMHFYFALILLHRPFLEFSQILHDLTNLTDLTSTSTGTCAIAAANITKLVLNYQRLYSIRQVPSPTIHFAFIAGTIHLVNFRVTKMDSHYQLLQGCLGALSEMRKSYPIAGKAASVLQDLIEGWEPSKETEPATATNMRVDVGNNATENDQQNYNWLEIEFPPFMEMQGLPELGSCALDDPTLSTTSLLPKELDLSGLLGPGSSLLPEDAANRPTDRVLFDTFYGNAFALG